MWEPGFWVLSDEEALRFREYLLKGGFAIFDDFEHEQWNNYEQQMRRVLQDGRFFKLADEWRLLGAAISACPACASIPATIRPRRPGAMVGSNRWATAM